MFSFGKHSYAPGILPTLSPYNHRSCVKHERFWAPPCSLAATKGIKNFSLFLRLLRCFTSAGFATQSFNRVDFAYRKIRFPHSEIPGSKVAKHLPEAYRSHATSFIASISQGIHHLLLKYNFYLYPSSLNKGEGLANN